MEELMIFYNRNGKKLFGIVHVPEQSAAGSGKIGINLLNPGMKYRSPLTVSMSSWRRNCAERDIM